MNPFRGKVYLPRAVLVVLALVLGLYVSSFFVDTLDFTFLVGFAYEYAMFISYAPQEIQSSSSDSCIIGVVTGFFSL